MQQASFAHTHTSPSAGGRPGAAVELCAATPRGEVRPYSPFGLMHLECVDAVKSGEPRGKTGQEQRGRTGLAA
jgi:hypothetical protein